MIDFKAFCLYMDQAQLTPRSPVEDIADVLKQANSLAHWFDRKRAINSIARCTHVDADSLTKLLRGVAE